jgi:DEAD/DEAH box helicase domain-containing protein
MNITQIIERWQGDPSIFENVSSWRVFPPRKPLLTEFPPSIHPLVENSLTKAGINHLYQHQYESFEKIIHQQNTLITSSTASGKSLCYNLPILHTLAHDADTCALYIFPTKALAHDQSHKLIKFIAGTDFNPAAKSQHNSPLVGIYDGDTSHPARRSIRENAQLLFTNPDMLHTGILPRHPQWSRFFSHLRFIVIDEIHIFYRGVFGSHVANVIRRLKRIASYYGSKPVFILTSGTISNPMDFARQLIGEDVSLVSSDGSPKGERYVLLYNPPITNEEFGLRVHPFREAVRFLTDLTEAGLRTIIFSQSRKSVERLLIESRRALSSFDEFQDDKISGYRSGYLPKDRRRLETALRDGKTRTIISTNALELGIDIGDLDSTILIGYPGTISSTWQQIARSGRSDRPSVAVLILNSTPLDQYLSKNPQYFWGRSPEQALINPNNPLILLHHLKCALYEIPIKAGYSYECGDPDLLTALLYALVQQGEALVNEKKEFYFIGNSSPHSFSLRSNSFKQINLILDKDGHQLLLGQVDDQSADWLVHPGAIYLHQGETYSVNALDLDTNIAKLNPIETEYYTQPIIDTQITQFWLIGNRRD